MVGTAVHQCNTEKGRNYVKIGMEYNWDFENKSVAAEKDVRASLHNNFYTICEQCTAGGLDVSESEKR